MHVSTLQKQQERYNLFYRLRKEKSEVMYSTVEQRMFFTKNGDMFITKGYILIMYNVALDQTGVILSAYNTLIRVYLDTQILRH